MDYAKVMLAAMAHYGAINNVPEDRLARFADAAMEAVDEAMEDYQADPKPTWADLYPTLWRVMDHMTCSGMPGHRFTDDRSKEDALEAALAHFGTPRMQQTDLLCRAFVATMDEDDEGNDAPVAASVSEVLNYIYEPN